MLWILKITIEVVVEVVTVVEEDIINFHDGCYNYLDFKITTWNDDYKGKASQNKVHVEHKILSMRNDWAFDTYMSSNIKTHS